MATQKARHMKRVAQHSVYLQPATLGTLVPSPIPATKQVTTAAARQVGKVTVISKAALQARKLACAERARQDIELAIAQWAAAELRVGQVFN